MDWTSQSDRELVTAYAQGMHETAFEELVRRHREMVFGTCRRVTGSEHDAEDLTQAVFALLANHASSIRTHTSPGGWLWRTAWNVSVKLVRETQRRHHREARVAATRPRYQSSNSDAIEVPAELFQALEELTEPHRDVIVLYHFVGLTLPQIAEMTGESVGTVTSRISRARVILRQRLSMRGIDFASVCLPQLWCYDAMSYLAESPEPSTVAVFAESAMTPAASLSAPLAVIPVLRGQPPFPVYEAVKTVAVITPATTFGLGTVGLSLLGSRAMALVAVAAIGTIYSGAVAVHHFAPLPDKPVVTRADARAQIDYPPVPNVVPEPTTAAIAGGAIAFPGLKRRR